MQLSAIPYPDPLFEQKRRRVTYNPKERTGEEALHEIVTDHFVLSLKNERLIYQQEREQQKSEK